MKNLNNITEMPKTLKGIIEGNISTAEKIHKAGNDYSNSVAKSLNQNNPALSQQVPWRISLARKQFVDMVTLPMQIWTSYINVFSEVLYPAPKQRENY
jgi:hypothetical protein